ncbi:hypothetical protein M595_1546 [Lyngbya aestuarii BL J]|uniref:Uncharacterized protein n=1 Tax=Lyngbya aestuarii BL J TaxID=1348334 RepID=U7QQ30_9CYAN|nr:hypothetical protein M595_1546 [Lyngbya aestuarii BL J]
MQTAYFQYQKLKHNQSRVNSALTQLTINDDFFRSRLN